MSALKLRMDGLTLRVHSLRAETHRGTYTVSRAGRGGWGPFFHPHDGGCEMLRMGTWREVRAELREHAARQPAHPPMLGWPACGEVQP